MKGIIKMTVTIRVIGSQCKVDPKLVPEVRAIDGVDINYMLVLTEAEILKVFKERLATDKELGNARKSYYQTVEGKANKVLAMLDKMYTTGRTPSGKACNLTKILMSIGEMLRTPGLNLEKLSPTGKEIAKKYLGS